MADAQMPVISAATTAVPDTTVPPATAAVVTEPETPATPPSIYSTVLDFTLLGIMVLVTIYVFVLLRYSVHTQINTYLQASDSASKMPDHAPELVFAFTRGMDAAIVKSTVIFMGFIVTIIGAMYVLRTATATFKLDAASGEQKGTLETSSPGLVMVVLGIVAVGMGLYSKTDVDITSTTPVIQPVQSQGQNSNPADTSHPSKPGTTAKQQAQSSANAQTSQPSSGGLAAVTMAPSALGTQPNTVVIDSDTATKLLKTYKVKTSADVADRLPKSVENLLDDVRGMTR